MFRPANNRVDIHRAAPFVGLAVAAALLVQVGCGAKTVKLTIPQLRDLETCVLQDDQVERQNCIERLFPKGER